MDYLAVFWGNGLVGTYEVHEELEGDAKYKQIENVHISTFWGCLHNRISKDGSTNVKFITGAEAEKFKIERNVLI